jgi:hypothetical protein
MEGHTDQRQDVLFSIKVFFVCNDKHFSQFYKAWAFWKLLGMF